MQRKKKFSQIISLALVIAMTLSLLPNTTSYAAETTDDSYIETTDDTAQPKDETAVQEDMVETTEDITDETTEELTNNEETENIKNTLDTESKITTETKTEENTEENTTESIQQPSTETTEENVTIDAEEQPNEIDIDESTEEPTEDTEEISEVIPTFTELYDGVSVAGMDFSSCELLIGTSDPSIFTEDTEVLSVYNNIYLTRYADSAQTMSAYTYYYNKADIVEVNSNFRANDEEASTTDAEEIANDGHGEADLSELNTGVDAFSQINNTGIGNYSGAIALIDTGASGGNVVGSYSVLGGSGADDNGHGTRLANAISEANPNARIVSIKALDSASIGSVSDVYAAMELAIRANVSVINLSMCSIATADSELLRGAINEAVGRGIIVVASAGNNGSNCAYFTPANISSVYTIGACDDDGNRISSSNYGADYYVIASSTSIAAAKFSAYAVNGLGSIDDLEDVFTRDFVESEKTTEQIDEIEQNTEESVTTYDVDITPETDSNNETKNEEKIGYNKPISSKTDNEGNELPNTSELGISSPSADEIANDILLQGCLTESDTWATCLNTIYGFNVTYQAVDSRPTGVPRYITASGMKINNGTNTSDASNYRGAIYSLGTLTANGGDLSNYIVWSSDNPSNYLTACYDHHVGIQRSCPSSGVSSINNINLEYAGYDSAGYYYYCNVINDWAPTHQRIFVYIRIFEKPVTVYYYGVGIVKTDENGVGLDGATFNVYSEDWGEYIGTTQATSYGGTVMFTWSEPTWRGKNFKVMLLETACPEGYEQNVGRRWGPFGVKGASVEPSPKTDGPFTAADLGVQADPTNEHDKYYYAVGLTKKDSVTNANLSGIKFDVYSSKSTSSTKYGSTITTDSNGNGWTTWESQTRVDNQQVYFYETYAPYPYEANIGKWYGPYTVDGPTTNVTEGVIGSNPYTAFSNVAANKVYELKNIPSYDGYVGIIKKDSVSNKNIKDVKFDIYPTKSTSLTKLGTITTGTNGKGSLHWESTAKYSTVYAYESYAPFPYNDNVGTWYTLTVSETQNGIVYKDATNTPKPYNLKIIKSSSNTTCTDNNPNYNLDGTKFEIYKKSTNKLCGTIEVNSKGETKTPLDVTGFMTAKDGGGYSDTQFYYKEIAVGKNYKSSNIGKISNFTIASTETEKSISVTNEPELDPVQIVIEKADSTGASGDLSNAQFTLKYYDLDASASTTYTAAQLATINPKRTWVIKTIYNSTKQKYMAVLDAAHKVSGNDFYYDNAGNITFPLGWLTIEETQAPVGYTIDDSVSVIKIDQPAAAGTRINVVNSAIMNSDGTGLLPETQIRADFSFIKRDFNSGEPMSNVEFEIRNTGTGEKYTVKTDANGYYSSADIAHSAEGGLWFKYNKDMGVSAVNDTLGALPFGDYELEELKCDANKGHQLEPVKHFSVDDTNNGTVIKVFDKTAKDSEEKIHDVEDAYLQTQAFCIETKSHTLSCGLEKPQTIEDKVQYWYLGSGEQFTLVGKLMVKEPDGTFHPYKKINVDASGNVTETDEDLIEYLSFTTEAEYHKSYFEQCGEKVMTFNNVMPLKKDEGKAYVVFEYLYKGTWDETNIDQAGEPYLKHEEDIYEQTIYVPKGETNAFNAVNLSKTVFPKVVQLTDVVEYDGLTIGKPYDLKTQIYIKEDKSVTGITYDKRAELEGNLMKDKDGNILEFTTQFTPTTTSGKTEITVEVDLSQYFDKTFVFLEDVYDEGILIFSHADVNDSHQSPHVPMIKTRAFGLDNTKMVYSSDKNIAFTDFIDYFNLESNTEYTAVGTAMDAETGEKILVDGKEVTATATFTTPEANRENGGVDGTAEVVFNIENGKVDLEGKTIVCYEELYIGKTIEEKYLVAEHKELKDLDQTLYVPKIRTRAYGVDDLKIAFAKDGTTTFTDYIDWNNLVADTTFTSVGTVMDAKTGNEVLLNGKPITAQTTFITPKADNDNNMVKKGVVEVKFSVENAKDVLEGIDIVIYEELYKGTTVKKENKVEEHKDIEDKEQRLKFIKIGTIAKDYEDNDKLLSPDGSYKIVDSVSCSNIEVDQEFKLEGVLMRKDTKEVLKDKNGNVVKASTTFVPKESSGSVDVTFDFETDLLDINLVVYEELYIKKNDKWVMVEEHKDINDDGQTVKIGSKGKMSLDKNPDESKKKGKVPGTGDAMPIILVDLICLLSLAGIIIIIRKKYKH